MTGVQTCALPIYGGREDSDDEEEFELGEEGARQLQFTPDGKRLLIITPDSKVLIANLDITIPEDRKEASGRRR